MNHCMVDIETMSTAPNAAITSIGAVIFNIEDGVISPDSFYQRVRLDSSMAAGLKVDAGTIVWWLRQADRSQVAAPAESCAALADVLYYFSAFYKGGECGRLWGHGATFDPVILGSAYEACKLPVPYGFRDVRDTRTLFELAGYTYKAPGSHHALEDAKDQAAAVIRAAQPFYRTATA